MLRDPNFLDSVPEEYKTKFIENDEAAPRKLSILKKMIHERFPVSFFTTYLCRFMFFDTLYDNTRSTPLTLVILFLLCQICVKL